MAFIKQWNYMISLTSRSRRKYRNHWQRLRLELTEPEVLYQASSLANEHQPVSARVE
jgi:hypothetical protein